MLKEWRTELIHTGIDGLEEIRGMGTYVLCT